MPAYREHDITLASFAQIDKELGDRKLGGKELDSHRFSEAEYAVVRRVIHTTADFEFAELMQFTGGPIEAAAQTFSSGCPIVTDVSMVAAGIATVVQRTWQSSVKVAVKQVVASDVLPRQTRSSQGMQQCLSDYPHSVFAVGNAPTALLTLCNSVANGQCRPALVIGAPVGFINVVESKQMLTSLDIPHVVVNGRKGGSAVAAAILNALMIWTWEAQA